MRNFLRMKFVKKTSMSNLILYYLRLEFFATGIAPNMPKSPTILLAVTIKVSAGEWETLNYVGNKQDLEKIFTSCSKIFHTAEVKITPIVFSHRNPSGIFKCGYYRCAFQAMWRTIFLEYIVKSSATCIKVLAHSSLEPPLEFN